MHIPSSDTVDIEVLTFEDALVSTNDAYDKDRALRKESFNKEIKLLESMSVPLTACLNSIKGTTITLNKRRLWQSAIDKALAQSRISQKTLTALIESIESSIPLWQEYLAIKAELLFPQEKNPKLAFYDLFAPLQDNSTSEKKQTETSYHHSHHHRRYTAFHRSRCFHTRRRLLHIWRKSLLQPERKLVYV